MPSPDLRRVANLFINSGLLQDEQGGNLPLGIPVPTFGRCMGQEGIVGPQPPPAASVGRFVDGSRPRLRGLKDCGPQPPPAAQVERFVDRSHTRLRRLKDLWTAAAPAARVEDRGPQPPPAARVERLWTA